MNIVFINQSLGIGGAETFNAQLIGWLRSKGHHVSCYAANTRFTQMLGEDTKMIPIILDIIGDWKGLVKAFFLWPFGLLNYTKIVWLNRKADVILMTGFIEKIIVTPLAKILKMRVVWVEFAPMQTIFAKFFGLPKLLYQLSSPNQLIVPTQNTLSRIQRKAIVIPCGENVDVKKYALVKIKKHSVCCVSRIEKGKGQDTLLKAWPQVLKKFPQATLYIVGEGDRLPSAKNVVFTGWVPDALKYIAECELVVFPSRWPLEGFGLVMVEAMALGKPVVAFDFGPVPEIIDSSTGILVQEDLAAAIIKLLAQPALAKKLGQAGQKKYQRCFTLDIIGPQYEKVLAN